MKDKEPGGRKLNAIGPKTTAKSSSEDAKCLSCNERLPVTHVAVRLSIKSYPRMPGADAGEGSLGSDEPPQRERNFLKQFL